MSFLGQVYPDEDFRSIVYRYFHLSGRRDISVINKKLFETTNRSIPVMTKNTGFMFNLILGNSGISFLDFLFNHTFFPIYRIFNDEIELERLINYLQCGDGNLEKNNRENKYISTNIRYCFGCLQSDYSKYGQCYIHRLHQIKGLDVCKEHKMLLKETCPHCNQSLANNSNRQLIKNTCPSCGKDLLVSKDILYSEDDNSLYEIIEDVSFLFSTKQAISRSLLKERYYLYSIDKGYLRYSGSYKNKKFISDYNERNETILFSCQIMKFERDSKVSSVLALKSRYNNFFMNIAIMRLFAGSIREFITSPPPLIISTIPFGNGPWECINPFCLEKGNKAIKKVHRIYDSKRTQMKASFECHHCKMIYARYFDPTKDNHLSENEVIHVGDVWKENIIELYQYDKNKTESDFGVSYAQYQYYRKTASTKLLHSQLPFEWFEKLIRLYLETNDCKKTANQLKITTEQAKQYIYYYLSNNCDLTAFKKHISCDEYVAFRIKPLISNCIATGVK
ncbi:TnsD family Tn7-like transposition protein [Paenibacillus albus]|uniref:Uncharacterized protein n=1 Tax=Paenibacillus albus TaxID=2495582 RepID=A0A3Q8X878_9BACL|nr:TnsD family Tn7-like transposition protein [Paenibacillus albus]AZN42690.1 hypothetical protein EJC50_25620 [Paenibacillus albus]